MVLGKDIPGINRQKSDSMGLAKKLLRSKQLIVFLLDSCKTEKFKKERRAQREISGHLSIAITDTTLMRDMMIQEPIIDNLFSK